jgi:extradiol dioxygenase family protein
VGHCFNEEPAGFWIGLVSTDFADGRRFYGEVLGEVLGEVFEEVLEVVLVQVLEDVARGD